MQPTTLTLPALAGWSVAAALIVLSIRSEILQRMPAGVGRSVGKCAALLTLLLAGLAAWAAGDSSRRELLQGVIVQATDPVAYVITQSASGAGNVLFALAVWPVLMLPVLIGQLPALVAFVREHRAFSSVLCGLAVIAALMFVPGHQHNKVLLDLLRNYALRFAISSWTGRWLFALLAAWGTLSLVSMRSTRPVGAITLFAWVGQLLPVLLIEPRYFIPAMSITMLFRRMESAPLEWLQLGYSIALALGLHFVHADTPLFL
jgi:hypothetical protein